MQACEYLRWRSSYLWGGSQMCRGRLDPRAPSAGRLLLAMASVKGRFEDKENSKKQGSNG